MLSQIRNLYFLLYVLTRRSPSVTTASTTFLKIRSLAPPLGVVTSVGWLGAGLAETWNTLDYLAEAGIRYVCDWVNDDQPYRFEIGTPPLVSLPYSVQTNDVPAYFEMKVSVPEFEAMLKRQFDTLYREGQTVPRVMAIAVHPYVTGQPHRIGALDAALEYICSHDGVWRATGWEIVQHFLAQQK